jgi:hypothetical protein
MFVSSADTAYLVSASTRGDCNAPLRGEAAEEGFSRRGPGSRSHMENGHDNPASQEHEHSDADDRLVASEEDVAAAEAARVKSGEASEEMDDSERAVIEHDAPASTDVGVDDLVEEDEEEAPPEPGA